MEETKTVSDRQIGWWPNSIVAREKWSVGTEGVGRGKDGLKSFFYSSILILTKFRSMSRQLVVCITETYNHICRS